MSATERFAALAGVVPDGALGEALAARATVLEMTEAARASVLTPRDPGAFSPAERAALAARVARLTGEKALAERYLGDAAPADPALAQPGRAPADARLAAAAAHLDLVAARPRDATAEDLTRLAAAGFTEADVVRLSQLIAFVAYEARLVAGLRALGAAR